MTALSGPGTHLRDPELWRGRVFTHHGGGGNETVVVSGQVDDPAGLARRLGVPDTAFVLSHTPVEIVLRTFSTVEELAQCWQTSIATPTALAVPLGQPVLVRHRQGEVLEVVRERELTWATPASPESVELEVVAHPEVLDLDLAPGTRPVVLRAARSRVHLRCADLSQLESLKVAPAEVLALCASLQISGIVLSAANGSEERVRVFTSSLAGHEDSATGGAVFGVGLLASRAGARGERAVRQGPPDPDRQGLIRLRLKDDGRVHLGGVVDDLTSAGAN